MQNTLKKQHHFVLKQYTSYSIDLSAAFREFFLADLMPSLQNQAYTVSDTSINSTTRSVDQNKQQGIVYFISVL